MKSFVVGFCLLLMPNLGFAQQPKALPPIVGTLKVGKVDVEQKELSLVGKISIPVTELVPLSVIENEKTVTKYTKVTKFVVMQAPKLVKFRELQFYTTKLQRLTLEEGLRHLRPQQRVIYTTALKNLDVQQLSLAPRGTVVILRVLEKDTK